MTFQEAIKVAETRYVNNRRFSLFADESINDVVRREKVPNVRGVYVIFKYDDEKKPLYIGKSGTLKQDGTWKEQSLSKRLTMKQDKHTYRKDYFRKVIQEECPCGLTFWWFATHDQNIRVIPALAEMELLQAYFDEYGCLPRMNKEV